MNTKKNKPPLVLDMNFDEALRRFVKTDPSELPDGVMLNRKRQTNKPVSNRKKGTKP